MIRRTWDSGWWLLTQTQHAELARQFATHIQFEFSNIGLDRELLLETIEHHDDGWSAADQTPTWSEELNRPVDFIDVTPETSLPVWEECIQKCLSIDPQAAYWVSRHFLALSLRILKSEETTPEQADLAVDFEKEQATLQQEWIATILTNRCAESQQAINEAGFGLLRSFDHLSLILTVARRTEPVVWPLTGYHEVTLTPMESSDSALCQFRASPWPFGHVSRVSHTAEGRLISQSVSDQQSLQQSWDEANMQEIEFELIR